MSYVIPTSALPAFALDVATYVIEFYDWLGTIEPAQGFGPARGIGDLLGFVDPAPEDERITIVRAWSFATVTHWGNIRQWKYHLASQPAWDRYLPPYVKWSDPAIARSHAFPQNNEPRRVYHDKSGDKLSHRENPNRFKLK